MRNLAQVAPQSIVSIRNFAAREFSQNKLSIEQLTKIQALLDELAVTIGVEEGVSLLARGREANDAELHRPSKRVSIRRQREKITA